MVANGSNGPTGWAELHTVGGGRSRDSSKSTGREMPLPSPSTSERPPQHPHCSRTISYFLFHGLGRSSTPPFPSRGFGSLDWFPRFDSFLHIRPAAAPASSAQMFHLGSSLEGHMITPPLTPPTTSFTPSRNNFYGQSNAGFASEAETVRP